MLLLLLKFGFLYVLVHGQKIESFSSVVSLGSESDSYSSVSVMSDGFIGVGGTSTFDIGDIMITKFNYDGSLVWSKKLGGGDNDYQYGGLSHITTSDGGFVIQSTTKSFGLPASPMSIMISKFDSQGNLEFQKIVGGSSQDLVGYSGLKQLADGGYLLNGQSQSWTTFLHGILLRYNHVGNLTWASLWGGSSNDMFQSVDVTPLGSIIVGGYSSGTFSPSMDVLLCEYSSSGSLIWNRMWGGSSTDQLYDIRVTKDGVFTYGVGYSNSFGPGTSNILVMKFNSTGGVLFAKAIGKGVSSSRAYRMIISNDGGVLLVGYTNAINGANDAILLKLNSTGDIVFAKYFGHPTGRADFSRGIAENTDGSIILSGGSKDMGTGLNSGLIWKLNAKGEGCGFKDWVGYSIQDYSHVPSRDVGGVTKTSLNTQSSPSNLTLSAVVPVLFQMNCTECVMNYYGKYCNITTCGTGFSNETSTVCGGHGVCVDYNKCECVNDYPYVKWDEPYECKEIKDCTSNSLKASSEVACLSTFLYFVFVLLMCLF